MGNNIASTTTSVMTTDRAGRAGHSRIKKEEEKRHAGAATVTSRLKNSDPGLPLAVLFTI